MAHLSQLQNRKEHIRRDYQNRNPLSAKTSRGNDALLGSTDAHRFDVDQGSSPQTWMTSVKSFVKGVDKRVWTGAAIAGSAVVIGFAARKWMNGKNGKSRMSGKSASSESTPSHTSRAQTSRAKSTVFKQSGRSKRG